MAKSNYPNKLDTSVEIPAVRNNIVEIGSDVINSLRSAIFQIEKTLGVNPQGAVGNSVADRLGKALDGNGNILAEAIDKSGLLSGPISNDNVSKTAAIAESKLNLQFPTTLLQSEISQLMAQLDTLEGELSEISATLSSHVHPSASNRHKGIAISIDKILKTASSIGVTSSEAMTAQAAFQQIYDSHINYDGSDISESNRSHTSDQIFFDDTNIAAVISADNVQDAIEGVANSTTGQVTAHQNLHHSNSILRSNLLTDSIDTSKGVSLVSGEEVFFTKSGTSADSFISNILFIDSPTAPKLSIQTSDIIEVTTSSEILSFQIYQANYSSDGLQLESVDVYGQLLANSESDITASIYRNKNKTSEPIGLLLTAREYQSTGLASFSNADVIQISNPNSANIVTKGIRPSEIGLLNRYVKISIDGASSVVLDLYDGDLALLGQSQSFSSILKTLNAQFAANRLSVSAYRLDYDHKKGSEIAFVHSLPSTSVVTHSIKFSRGSDDALDSIGLTSFEDITIVSESGTQYTVQGSSFLGLATKVDTTGFTLLSGTSSVLANGVDFIKAGVRDGDILTISGSPGDDGTFVILDVSEDSISVDRTQLISNQWASISSDDTRFVIQRNSISLNNMAFKVLPGGASSASVIDIAMDKDNRDVFYKERLTYGTEVYVGSESLAAVVDFSGDVSVYTSTNTGSLRLDKASSDPADLEVQLSLDSGEVFKLKNAKSEYVTLYSGKYNTSIIVFVKNSDTIASKIVNDGSGFVIALYGYAGISEDENLLLGRVLYDASVSRIAGAGRDYPRVFGKLRKGSVGINEIGTDTLFGLYQSPLLETRSNGVIRGLEITQAIDNGLTYTISISAGVCYVGGKRFELDEVTDFITDIETGPGVPIVDKFYIAINSFGGLVFKVPDPVACDCPFSPYSYCILGSVENSGTIVASIDLRLFIDNLDLRILNSITVSPQPGMGHFSNINKALKYAKRFAQAFPKAGIPTVHLKSGTHQIITDMGVALSAYTPLGLADIQPAYDGGMWINFPVNIVGEGPSTVLDFIRTFTDANASADSRANAVDSKMHNWMYVVGAGLSASAPDGDSDVLSAGTVNIRDLKFRLGGILILDPIIEAGAAKLNVSINIDNVIFDNSEKAGFDHFNYGLLIQGRDSVAGGKIGNISVTNCEFLNSHIKSNTHNSEDHFNIKITGNKFRGTGDGAVDGESHYAMYITGTGNIFDFEDASAYNNIEFRHNTMSDSLDSGSAPTPDSDGDHLWGDRISRGLYVGNRIGVGTSKDANSELTVFKSSSSTARAHIGDLRESGFGSPLITSDVLTAELTLAANSAAGAVKGFVRVKDSSEGMTIGTRTNDPVSIVTNNTKLITLDSAGGLGLNTITTVGFDASDNFPNGYPGLLNIEKIGLSAATLVPFYLGSTNSQEYGSIAAKYLSGTSAFSNINFGVYDIDNALGSLLGTNYHDKFQMDMENARFDIFQGSDQNNSGVRFHKAGTLAGEGATDSIYWNAYYETATGLHNEVLGFRFFDSTSGSISALKAFIRSDTVDTDGLDFTGQHRSDSDESLKIKENIGLIVSSAGIYKNLDQSASASINEALPIVELSSQRRDKRAYGVISNVEDPGSTREYSSGSFVSVAEKQDDRLIINALGEGGIWVCNINGMLENGDYITTCEIPGYGMLQDDDLLHNYTVAKITCDCSFELDSDTYDCIEFEYNGNTYRKAFVGCTYHCG